MGQIDQQASVTLDGNGAGRVSLGPPAGTRWALALANVSVVKAGTGAAPSASSTCILYRGSTNGPTQQVDVAQFTGNAAASGKVGGAPYFPGQVLWAVWSGGDAGAIATLQIYGQQANRSDPPFEPAPLGEGFPSIPSQVIIGDPRGPHIFIGQPVPAELLAYYTASGFDDIVSGWIGFYISATDYFYVIAAGGSVSLDRILGIGVVIAGTVNEILKPRWFHTQNESALISFPGIIQLDAASGGLGGILLGANSTPRVLVGTNSNKNVFTGGLGAGLGTVDAVNVTTAGALTVASAAEADIPNLLLSLTSDTTRQYVITAEVALAMSTGTDTWQIQCRLDTALTGTVIGRSSGSGGTAPVALLSFPWNPTDNNVHTLHFSCDVIVGAGTAQAFGSPGGVVARTWSEIRDDAPSSSWRTA